MNNENTVSQRLNRVIAEKTKMDISDIRSDLNFEDSGLDSFARIELILLIEQEFGIELSDAESASVTTVADIAEMIEKKV